MKTLLKILKKGSKRLVYIFKAPFLSIGRKVKKVTSPDSITSLVINDVKKTIKSYPAWKKQGNIRYA